MDERPAPVAAPAVKVLFAEARQRRRRLRIVRVALALVTATVLAAVGAVVVVLRPSATSSASGTPTASVLRARTGATLVSTGADVRVIDADTGAARTLPLPAPEGGASDRAMMRVGGALLLNRGDTAWLYPPGLDGPPVDLGPSERIIPGPGADEVWLWWIPGFDTPTGVPATSTAESDEGQGDVRLVDLSGRQIGAPVVLPIGPVPPGNKVGAGWFPTGEVVGTGLVLESAYGPTFNEVWDPVTGRVTHVFPVDAVVLAARDDLVAWAGNGHCLPACTVHLTDVRTGTDRSLSLPADTVSADATFSPDGSTLAVAVSKGNTSRRGRTAMVLVDVRTGTVSLLAGSAQTSASALGPLTAGWSRGGWLFFTVEGSRRILAWHAGYHSATVLPRARIPRLAPLGPDGQNFTTLIAL